MSDAPAGFDHGKLTLMLPSGKVWIMHIAASEFDAPHDQWERRVLGPALASIVKAAKRDA